jgi:hypothetical protein
MPERPPFLPIVIGGLVAGSVAGPAMVRIDSPIPRIANSAGP